MEMIPEFSLPFLPHHSSQQSLNVSLSLLFQTLQFWDFHHESAYSYPLLFARKLKAAQRCFSILFVTYLHQKHAEEAPSLFEAIMCASSSFSSLWSEKYQEGKGESKEIDGDTLASTAVGELVNSFNQQRVHGEVTLALRTGLRDACAEFSFLRIRGLRSILKFLHNVAESDATIDLFNQTQSIPDLQVVPVLFQYSLKETGDDYNDDKLANLNHIFGVDPMIEDNKSIN